MVNAKIIREMKAEYKKALNSIDRINLRYLTIANKEPRLGQATTSIRVTLDTKNKLRMIKKGDESFDELIQRLLDSLERKEKTIQTIQENIRSDSYITTILKELPRTKIFIPLFPGMKVEVSFNQKPAFDDRDFIFNLEMEKIFYKGHNITLEECMRKLVLKSLSEKLAYGDDAIDIMDSIESIKTDLTNKDELIELKYMLHFFVLYHIIDKSGKRSPRFNELLLKDFWRRIYDYYELPQSSFKYDILDKLEQMKCELRQAQIDKQR